MQLFGSSGIRSFVGTEFLQLSFSVGLVLGRHYHRVVVGQDTRTSSEAVKHSLMSGLLAAGAKAYDAGIVPTPTLAYVTRRFEAGVMVTASHNPPEYNGIKLWNPDGSAFDSAQRQDIEALLSRNELEAAPWYNMQPGFTYQGAIQEHMERIWRDFTSKAKLKVAVDCGSGAASLITPYLLQRQGYQVLAINCHPSGFFPRDSEPTPESLAEFARVVKAIGADLGIAHDGDGDRMVVIDDEGRFVPGDRLMVVLAQALGVKEVVTTVDASMMIEELGYKVVRTRVGDAFVSEALKKGGDMGGETSGCWVFPKVSLCPDGIYAAALIASVASRRRLSELLDGLPRYYVVRGNVPGDKWLMPQLQEKLAANRELHSLSTVEGIRLGAADGWLLIRPSGTEPKIRITAEAKEEQGARRLYRLAVQAVEESIAGVAPK